MSSPWLIPDINARLCELHPDNTLSFRDIAARLNEEFGTTLTRHACIGRADRLKFAKRPSPILPKKQTAIDPPTAAPGLPKLPKRQFPAAGKTFADLALDDCRWPFGEPTEKPVLFCGRLAREGTSWCEKHHAMAYVPTRLRWA